MNPFPFFGNFSSQVATDDVKKTEGPIFQVCTFFFFNKGSGNCKLVVWIPGIPL